MNAFYLQSRAEQDWRCFHGSLVVHLRTSLLVRRHTHTHAHTTHTQIHVHVCALMFTCSGHPHHVCTLQTHTLRQAQLQYKETRGVAGPPEGGRKASLPALEPEDYWDEELRALCGVRGRYLGSVPLGI